jgi:hypothetical protein
LKLFVCLYFLHLYYTKLISSAQCTRPVEEELCHRDPSL